MLWFEEKRNASKFRDQSSADRISVLLPVLNEAKRIERALESLIAQPEEVHEILSYRRRLHRWHAIHRHALSRQGPTRATCRRQSGGSSLDRQSVGTQFRFAALEPGVSVDSLRRCRRLGFAASWRARFWLTQAKPASQLFPSPRSQHLSGKIEALIHPAMLTTLVYRFGSPGKATRNRHKVQANGQCFFSRRRRLLKTAAFHAAQSSLCEDITIVRRLRRVRRNCRLLRSRRLGRREHVRRLARNLAQLAALTADARPIFSAGAKRSVCWA